MELSLRSQETEEEFLKRSYKAGCRLMELWKSYQNQ